MVAGRYPHSSAAKCCGVAPGQIVPGGEGACLRFQFNGFPAVAMLAIVLPGQQVAGGGLAPSQRIPHPSRIGTVSYRFETPSILGAPSYGL